MIARDRFEWFGEDGDAIIVPEQRMTAVHWIDGHRLAIRQKGEEDDRGDHLLAFSPEAARAVAQMLLDEIEGWEADFPHLVQKAGPLTAAERQRRYRRRHAVTQKATKTVTGRNAVVTERHASSRCDGEEPSVFVDAETEPETEPTTVDVESGRVA